MSVVLTRYSAGTEVHVLTSSQTSHVSVLPGLLGKPVSKTWMIVKASIAVMGNVLIWWKDLSASVMMAGQVRRINLVSPCNISMGATLGRGRGAKGHSPPPSLFIQNLKYELPKNSAFGYLSEITDILSPH